MSYKAKMKRMIITLLVFVCFVSLSPLALANVNEGFEYSVEPGVSMRQDGTAEFDISVTGVDVYAGAQFELILSEGVSIESIAFDKGAGFSTIPPTYARGAYYFSLIAGTNEYEGDFTCTVEISYKGTEPAEIIISEIQVYYIVAPGDVESAINSISSTIKILPFGYVMIGDTAIPLGWLAQNWIWILVSLIVIATVIIIVVRQRRTKKKIEERAKKIQSDTEPESDKNKVTIDKDEYERLIALKHEKELQSTESDNETGTQ